MYMLVSLNDDSEWHIHDSSHIPDSLDCLAKELSARDPFKKFFVFEEIGFYRGEIQVKWNSEGPSQIYNPSPDSAKEEE